MLGETLSRVSNGPDVAFGAPMIVCGAGHYDLVASELTDAGLSDSRVILEPFARNTAPALAAAAIVVAETDPDALMLVLPADHVVSRPDVLREACITASAAANAGHVVAFAITPDRAETGYGYIRAGTALEGGVRVIDAFVEKPDLPTAEGYIASGDYAWNAGIFFFAARTLIDELRLHAPAILTAAENAVRSSVRDAHVIRLDAAAFATAPSVSIDYAVMEPTARAAVVAVDMGWNDVGSFATLWDIRSKDEAGNAVSGEARVFDSRNCLVRAGDVPVAVIGMDDVMVISTEHGVLVAPRSRAQDVRLAANAFKSNPAAK
jgi:mannose-1-phosphate guanylyltransferase/mannose-1-phosphate guanylyltransferase/mannose-6-phosphate isomerase